MIDVITLANQIAAEKENIRKAIENRGVDIPVTAPLSEYAGKIAQIEAQVSEGDFFWNDTEYDKTAPSYTVPGNYDEIDKDAFASNTNLISINFNNVRKVGNGACNGCSNLSTIVGNNVFEYGDGVFGGCNITSFNDTSSQIVGNNLLVNNPVTTVTLNAKRIGSNICPNNNTLESVSLPNATTLGYGSFLNCSKLNTISAPNLEYVGDYAFSGINTYNYNADPSTTQVDIELPNAKIIGNNAFSYSPSIRSLTAPLVERIESGAFNYTGNDKGRMTELNLPRCTYIGTDAFAYTYSTGSSTNSYKINSLTIGDGCTIYQSNFPICPDTIVGKIGHIQFDGGALSSMFSLEWGGNVSHTADFSGLVTMSKSLANESFLFNFNGNVNTTVQFGGAIDLKSLVSIVNSGNYAFRIFNNARYDRGRITKVWINKDLTLSGIAANSIYLLNALDSNTHIYTDAESKPDNWGGTKVGGNGTWHFGCTHQDFENGIYNS